MEATAVGNGVTVQSTIKRTGGYALRCNPPGAAPPYGQSGARLAGVSSQGVRDTVLAAATAYYRFYFRYAVKAGGGECELAAVLDTAWALKISVKLTSTGKLVAFDSTNTQMGDPGATVLSADTWYCIGIACGTGGTAAYSVSIDDKVELSGTGNVATVNNGGLGLGKYSAYGGQLVDYFFDDVVIDDANLPGLGEVHYLRADSNGTDTGFEASAGQKWECVAETPPNDVDFIGPVGGILTPQIYTAGLSAPLVTKAVEAVMAIVSVNAQAVEPLTYSKVRLRGPGGVADTTQVGPLEGFLSLPAQVSPGDGLAWTIAILSSLEAGVIYTLSDPPPVTVYMCDTIGVMVDFRETLGRPLWQAWPLGHLLVHDHGLGV